MMIVSDTPSCGITYDCDSEKMLLFAKKPTERYLIKTSFKPRLIQLGSLYNISICVNSKQL